jgi:hypothetical protein
MFALLRFVICRNGHSSEFPFAVSCPPLAYVNRRGRPAGDRCMGSATAAGLA